MELRPTYKFDAAYDRLTVTERRIVNEKLRLLANDYRHPGLRARKWREPNSWYARISRDIRLFYENDVRFLKQF